MCRALPCPGCARSRDAPTHLLRVSAQSPAIAHLSMHPSGSAPASAWPSPRLRGRGCLPAPHSPLPPCSLQGMGTLSQRVQSQMQKEGRRGSGCCLRCCAQLGDPSELAWDVPCPLAALYSIPLPCSLPLSAHTHPVPGRAVPRAGCDTDPLLSVQVQFSFWLLRYLCTFMLFVLGMKAPGLPRKPYMLLSTRRSGMWRTAR